MDAVVLPKSPFKDHDLSPSHQEDASPKHSPPVPSDGPCRDPKAQTSVKGHPSFKAPWGIGGGLHCDRIEAQSSNLDSCLCLILLPCRGCS